MPKIKAFAETKRNRFLNEITLMAIYVKRVPLYAPHGKRAASWDQRQGEMRNAFLDALNSIFLSFQTIKRICHKSPLHIHGKSVKVKMFYKRDASTGNAFFVYGISQGMKWMVKFIKNITWSQWKLIASLRKGTRTHIWRGFYRMRSAILKSRMHTYEPVFGTLQSRGRQN